MTNVSKELELLKSAVWSRYQKVIEKHKHIDTYVHDEIEQWRASTRRFVDTQNPYHELKRKALSGVVSSPKMDDFDAMLTAFTAACTKYHKQPSNFWANEKAKLENLLASEKNNEKVLAELATSYQLLNIEYQKLAESLYSHWELSKIRQMREEFLNALLNELANIESLLEYIELLGLDPGILFDLSDGFDNQIQIDEVLRWLEYLKNDEGVQRLLELMGKISQAKQSEMIDKVVYSQFQTIRIPDINSREEIIGVKLGKDIEHALPAEIALLSDPDTSLLFDLKFIESSLLCFEMEGTTEISNEVQIEAETTTEEDDEKGPLVICIDTSASMQGAPETIAKAVTLIMATKARQRQRSCYLINFSTGISTIDLSTDFSMDTLLTFLQMSFHGGTDAAPAIEHGLEMMDTEEYSNADMLVISDFVMASLPESLVSQMEKHRLKGTKFNSLVIDETFMDNRMRSLFDHEWMYNPSTSSISEIVEFERCI